MTNPLPLSHAERGLKHRNFTCAICRQRWEEGQENGPVLKDGLFVGKLCCADPNGDVIERDNVRARAAALGAILNAKEMRPPVYPTPLDGRSLTESWISDFSVRPVELSVGVSAEVPNLVLAGGFLSTSAFTFDGGVTADSTITRDTATLIINPGDVAGLFALYLDGAPYPASIKVYGG